MQIFINIVTVYSLLMFSGLAIVFLDFAFGLDYFKKYSITKADPLVQVTFGYSVLFSILHMAAYLCNSTDLLSGTTFLILGMLAIVWMYYTVKYSIAGVLALRSFCKQKRKKPY